MKKTLVIILWLEGTGTMTLDIPNPRDDLTGADVSMAMFEALRRNVIQNDKGVLAHSFKHAYIRTVDEELLP